jgi:hypothetical protein
MRTRSVAAALFVAVASALMHTTSAYAQTSDDPILKAARARFNEGVAFYDKAQYENARAAFLQAYALRKHPAVLINLAQSSLHSGHTLEAARYFQQYLRDSSSLSAVQRTDTEKALADARTKLGRLEVSAADGTEIKVDGDPVGTAPLAEAVDVEPGSHTVRSGTDSKTVTVAAGQVEPVSLNAPPSTPVEPVTVTPVATPQPEEQSPPPPTAAVAAKPAPVVADTGRSGLFAPPKTMVPVWIGLGVGIVGGATAILFAAFKSEASSRAQSVAAQIDHAASASGVQSSTGLCLNPPRNLQQGCQTLQHDNRIVDSDATAANVGLGVGIAGVAFGLGWYLFAPKREAASTATGASGTFVPIVSPYWRGLGYEGSF